MAYLLAHRQPGNREEDETGPAQPHFPDTTDTRVRPVAERSSVIPQPVNTPPEIVPQAWQPPKEVIWMGQPQTVLAMSLAIATRLAEAAAGSG